MGFKFEGKALQGANHPEGTTPGCSTTKKRRKSKPWVELPTTWPPLFAGQLQVPFSSSLAGKQKQRDQYMLAHLGPSHLFGPILVHHIPFWVMLVDVRRSFLAFGLGPKCPASFILGRRLHSLGVLPALLVDEESLTHQFAALHLPGGLAVVRAWGCLFFGDPPKWWCAFGFLLITQKKGTQQKDTPTFSEFRGRWTSLEFEPACHFSRCQKCATCGFCTYPNFGPWESPSRGIQRGIRIRLRAHSKLCGWLFLQQVPSRKTKKRTRTWARSPKIVQRLRELGVIS